MSAASCKLDAAERARLLAALPDWRFHDQRGGLITRRFSFADFTAAFGFMAQLALVAERMNHHPEWSNVYSRVEITLTTHDAPGLTAADIELARAADRAFANFSADAT